MKNIIKISLCILLYSELFAKEDIEVFLANYVKAWQEGKEYCGETCKMLQTASIIQDSIAPFFYMDSSLPEMIIQSKLDMQSLYYQNEASRTAMFMIFRDSLFSDSSLTLLPLKNEKQEKRWRIQTQWSQMRDGEISDGYIFICISQFEAWICDEQ